jgi:hypothetical protein
MRIWIDKNYNILKSDNNNIFGKGNNLNDRIEVLLPTNFSSENILPAFKFRLASNRTLGAYTHNETSYEFDNEYTAFPFVLNDTILSVKGDLEITIELQFYNKSLQLVRTKNVTAKAIVMDHIVLNDEIYIVGNEGEIIEAVRENMNALNARQTELEHNVNSKLSEEDITWEDGPAFNDDTNVSMGFIQIGDKRINIYSAGNYAGASNSNEKLYLVGAKNQYYADETFSNANVYTENDALHAPKVETEAINDTPITDFVKLVNGSIPSSYLPSYVDDVIDVQIDHLSDYTKAYKVNYMEGGAFTIGDLVIPEHNKIYVNVDGNTYRWSGSKYVEISKGLALGTTSSTAFAGNRGLALEKEVASLNNDKQDKLIAGDGITISVDGTISINYPNGDDLTYGG